MTPSKRGRRRRRSTVAARRAASGTRRRHRPRRRSSLRRPRHWSRPRLFAAPMPTAPDRGASSTAWRTARAGRSRTPSPAPGWRPSPACDRPCAHGAMAPSSSDFDSSGTTSRGSKSWSRPAPGTSVQAPCGELNENRAASSRASRCRRPRRRTCARRAGRRTRGVDDDNLLGQAERHLERSVSRRSMPLFTIRRSTKTSMLWFGADRA